MEHNLFSSTSDATSASQQHGETNPERHRQGPEAPGGDDVATRRRGIIARSLWFSRQRWLWAVFKLVWGAACGSFGVFLLSWINTTPALSTQLWLLGSLALIVSVAMAYLAARELLGRLVVSGHGISLLPTLGGFHVRWDDLAGWDMWPEGQDAIEYQQLLLYRRGAQLPKVVNVAWLQESDRQWLRQALIAAGPSA